MQSRGRLERGNPALAWQTHVRHHHCIGPANAVVERQDRTRRLRQRAKHAWRLHKRLRRNVLTIAPPHAERKAEVGRGFRLCWRNTMARACRARVED